MVKIAHASIDENGHARNGKAGDQTKKEVCIRSWYNKPWNVLVRFNDQKQAQKIADFMKAAAANDNIGYDQNQRNTLLAECKKVNFDVSKVGPCECDCSSLVSIACMYAGIGESYLVSNGNCKTTHTLRRALLVTGKVTAIEDKNILSSCNSLKVGDILISEGHHVVVVVEV